MMYKKCLFCGEDFIPTSNHQKYCTRDHWRSCPSCGKMYLEKFPENLSKPARLCSPRCSSAKQRDFPVFSEIARVGDHVIVDSTVSREKYDNLTISKWFHSQGLQCVHLFPGESADKLISWCDESTVYDASCFQTYKLNLKYAEEFIEKNDIVKFHKNTSVAIGLVKDYEIYQVLCFSSPRYDKRFNYEISHFCTKQGCKIVGGLDSLTSSASLLLGVTDCICYVDLSKIFDPSKFLLCGLHIDHVNVPRLRSSSVYDCGTQTLMF